MLGLVSKLEGMDSPTRQEVNNKLIEMTQAAKEKGASTNREKKKTHSQRRKQFNFPFI